MKKSIILFAAMLAVSTQANAHHGTPQSHKFEDVGHTHSFVKKNDKWIAFDYTPELPLDHYERYEKCMFEHRADLDKPRSRRIVEDRCTTISEKFTLWGKAQKFWKER